MRVNRTNPSPTQAVLHITVDAEELTKAKNTVLNRLAPQVKVPGFRSGKVPLNLAEKHIDANMLQSETMEEALNKLYAKAVRVENLRPVANPEVSIKKFVPFTELEFEATVSTIGAIKLADYTKIKVARKLVEVNDEDIKGVLNSLQKRAAKKKEVDGPAHDGDQVWIDFVGKDSKGQPVAGADGKDYPLILGSNTFIPGFETHLVGVKKNEERTFSLTFPKDYGVKALRSKKVTFVVTVTKVEQLNLPDLSDAFAAQVGPFQTIDELTKDIKQQLIIERAREADQQLENELLQQITEKSTIEIPESLIESQVDAIEQEEKQNLAYRGQTFEEHLKDEGVTPEEHRQQKRPAAEQRLKTGIILTEIADLENIEVTSQEVEVRLQVLRGQYKDPAMQAELQKPEVLRDIAGRLKSEKTLARLVQLATDKKK